VNLQAAVVLDEPELPKLVHEKVHARARRPDHLGECFLGHSRKRPVGHVGFTVSRQQQQRAGEALLAGVEQLINQIFFDPDVPREHVCEEAIRKCGCGVKAPHHFLSVDDDDRARRHGGSGRHP